MSSAATFTASNGDIYVDKKRHMWLVSLIIPAMGVAGPLLYMLYGNEFFIWMFFLIAYGVFPVIDYVLGEDTSNPPESVVPQLEADPYYRMFSMLHVPIVLASVIFCGWFVANHVLSIWGYIGTAL
ncbi:MAG: alkane 1-monooxygenase, partial [Oleiphilaceae bacterium]|nr:alkane 1-monooxygenase [Oleiphilaceae bacterium]